MNAMQRAVAAGDTKYIVTCSAYKNLESGVFTAEQAEKSLQDAGIKGSDLISHWKKRFGL